MPPRVFIPEPAPQYETLGAASVYGVITPLRTYRNFNPFAAQVTRLMEEALDHARFDPDVDYLCLTGKIASVALMIAVAMAKWGTVKVLIYSSRSSAYEEVHFGQEKTERARARSD